MEETLEPQDAHTEVPEGNPTPSEGGEDTPRNEEEFTPEQLADLKKKADVSSQNYERAKKAEAELKELKSKAPKEKEVQLTTKDTIALVNAKIETDDFDSVIDWAKFKGISVSDALKDKTLQTVLREKSEERQTAQATSTKGGRSFSRETPENIIARASKGDIPEDDEGIAKLAEAHMQIKLRKLQK